MAKNLSEDFDKLINEYQIKRYPNNRATIYDPNIISKRKLEGMAVVLVLVLVMPAWVAVLATSVEVLCHFWR